MESSQIVTLVSVAITAVVGPLVLLIAAEAIKQRNDSRRKGLEAAMAQDRRLRSLERKVRRLEGQPRRIRRRPHR